MVGCLDEHLACLKADHLVCCWAEHLVCCWADHLVCCWAEHLVCCWADHLVCCWAEHLACRLAERTDTLMGSSMAEWWADWLALFGGVVVRAGRRRGPEVV